MFDSFAFSVSLHCCLYLRLEYLDPVTHRKVFFLDVLLNLVNPLYCINTCHESAMTLKLQRKHMQNMATQMYCRITIRVC